MEQLYNGIVLPEQWPPRYDIFEHHRPIPVPYLEQPPAVINVDVGRQLFVDSFLIGDTDLTAEFHEAEKYQGNPVLWPETRQELGDKGDSISGAGPELGGVWYDKKEHCFKMWYDAGRFYGCAYAVSEDGIHWERPVINFQDTPNDGVDWVSTKEGCTKSPSIYPNRILHNFRPDSNLFWMDDNDVPERRYKLCFRGPGGEFPALVAYSGDGIHFRGFTETPPVGDRTTIYYNPFRGKWVYSIRCGYPGIGRAKRYRECDDLLKGARWEEEDAVPWMRTDEIDHANAEFDFAPQLYAADAVAYESVMLGMFQIMQGPENDVCAKMHTPKITELQPMFSRDGFHWTRPFRRPVVRAERIPGRWDRGYVAAVGGICITFDDEIRIYYTGVCGNPDSAYSGWQGRDPMYEGTCTGFATLRRDGFTSMHAPAGGGTLTTRPLQFTKGSHFFVNVKGTLRAEILDESGAVLPDFSLACSSVVSGDFTKKELCWKGDLSALRHKTIRLKFCLDEGDLYAFWFSETQRGESGGYLPNACLSGEI